MTGPIVIHLDDDEEPPDGYVLTEYRGKRLAVRPLTSKELECDLWTV